MKVAGIVVNYRTPELTARAVSALLPEIAAAGGGVVFVVENDSRDGSLESLRAAAAKEGWGDRVVLLESPRNGGYGYGINVAAERALALADKPDYLYILNPDAVAVSGSLARLVGFLDAHADVGIAGSEIRGEDGQTQAACFNYPSVPSEFEDNAQFGLVTRLLRRYVISIPTPSHDRKVDWVPGTSMLVRRRVFEEVGFFDEGFFLYFEEIDFCERARQRGFSSWFVADAPIVHVGSASTGMLDQSRRMPNYWFESRHRYFLKHRGRAYTALADAAWASGLLLGRAKRTILRRRSTQRPRLLRDFLEQSARALLKPWAPAKDEARVEQKSQRAGGGKSGASDPRPAEAVPLFELVAEDFVTHDRNVLEPGFWAVAVHRIGTHAAGRAPDRLRVPIKTAYKLLFTAVDWTWGIHLPREVTLGRRVRLWHNGAMFLRARSIGNDVHIRHATTFGPVRAGESGSEALPAIEDRADIGSGVCVLGDVTVGHDALVGANSVVMKPVPPGATVLGVPARLVPT